LNPLLPGLLESNDALAGALGPLTSGGPAILPGAKALYPLLTGL